MVKVLRAAGDTVEWPTASGSMTESNGNLCVIKGSSSNFTVLHIYAAGAWIEADNGIT